MHDSTQKNIVYNFLHKYKIIYILILENLISLQQSPDLRAKKTRQDLLLSNRGWKEDIATCALAVKLFMKNESTIHKVAS